MKQKVLQLLDSVHYIAKFRECQTLPQMMDAILMEAIECCDEDGIITEAWYKDDRKEVICVGQYVYDYGYHKEACGYSECDTEEFLENILVHYTEDLPSNI